MVVMIAIVAIIVMAVGAVAVVIINFVRSGWPKARRADELRPGTWSCLLAVLQLGCCSGTYLNRKICMDVGMYVCNMCIYKYTCMNMHQAMRSLKYAN